MPPYPITFDFFFALNFNDMLIAMLTCKKHMHILFSKICTGSYIVLLIFMSLRVITCCVFLENVKSRNELIKLTNHLDNHALFNA